MDTRAKTNTQKTDKEHSRRPDEEQEPHTLTASASPEQRSLDAMWERLYIRV